MDYTGIIKKAAEITARHCALWLYGFLLALFGGGAGANFGQGFRAVGNGGPPAGQPPFSPADAASSMWILLLVIAVVVFIVAWIITGAIARYVSTAALVGMVRDVEETGETAVRDGWRWGWSVRAWRLFLIGLIVGIPLAVIAILLVGMAASPLVLLFTKRPALQVGSVILAIVLFLMVLLLLVIVGTLVGMVLEIVNRECVLGNHGVRDSLRRGIAQVRQRPRPVVTIGLILVGLGWLWGLFMIPTVVLIVGGAALPALITYAAAGGLGAALVGVPLILLALVVLSALNGLFITFRSTVWTLTYLDLGELQENR